MNDRDSNLKNLNYRNTELLKKFLNAHGRILSSKKTGLNAKNQRKIMKAIKQARYMALLPYVNR